MDKTHPQKRKIWSHRYIRNLPAWSLQRLHDFLVSIHAMVDYVWASGSDDSCLPVSDKTRHLMMTLMTEKFCNGETLNCTGTMPDTDWVAHDGTDLNQFHGGTPCIFCAPDPETPDDPTNWFGVIP